MNRDALKIDSLQLEKEWMNQPGLYMYWAEKAAAAREKMELARFDLDRATAEISSRIRKNPEKYDLVKATESAITNQVLLDKTIEAKTKKYIKAKTENDILSKFVVALDQRKKALENLCFLTNQSFFAQPQDEPPKRRMRKRSS